MKYILIVILSQVLLSCSFEDEEENKVLEKNNPYTITEQTFRLDFRPTARASHVYTDYRKDESLVYFSDFVSAKKMSFFDLEGKHQFSVEVDSLVNTGVEILDAFVQHQDTIFLLENHSKNLYELDSTGSVRGFNAMDNYKSDLINEYRSSIYATFGSNRFSNCFYFSNELSIENEFNAKDGVERIDRLKKYYNISRKEPALISVSFIEGQDKKQIEYKPIFRDVQSEYAETDDFLFEFSYYYISERYIFLASWYSDNVFVYDRIEDRRLKNILIESNYTAIGAIPPFKINKENLEKTQSLLDQRGKFNGRIMRVFYDDNKNFLYVLVEHELKGRSSKENLAVRPWSLIVYNEDFEKVYEKAFEQGVYRMTFTKLTPRGLMILQQDKEQYEKNKRSEEKLYTFDIFDFDL